MFSDVVILAGGFGERLWPASCPERPKQFLNLGKGPSLIQSAMLRALSLNVSGKIIIATRKDIQNQCAEQAKLLLPSLSDEQKNKLKKDLLILAEPCPKHTTAPIILSCHMLDLLSPTENHSILVLTSDHIIEPIESFANDCEKAHKAALQSNFVCFGIKPVEAATGYGYIKAGEETAEATYKIDGFKEKPDQKTAEEYLASGNYWWNSGMFGFTTKFLETELSVCGKTISDAFDVVKNGKKPKIAKLEGFDYIKKWPEMDAAYSKTPAIAIDVSIAEKTKNAYAIKASFSWDDVGSWDSFAKFSTKSDKIIAEVKTEGCFVYSDIPVALCGVDDLIVVIKNNKALIVKKGQSSLVREATKQIKEV
jgi:mannose-1-phosphate guanylyltransferase